MIYILLYPSMIITIIFSFIFTGLFVKRLSIFEIEEEEKKEKEMIQYANKLNFEYKYLDELKLLEDIVLEEAYIKELENIKLEIEVPNNKLIIFYKDCTFMYYTEFGDVIYKYLNVACRKYVIDNNCLQIYNYDNKVDKKEDNKVDKKEDKKGDKEGDKEDVQKGDKEDNNLFVKKKIIKKENIEKKMNKTRWLGTFNDMKNEIKVNDISFMDFLKLSPP